MVENKSYIIIGNGGHAFSVIDSHIDSGKSIKYYTAINESNNNPFRLEYLGIESDLNFIGWAMNLTYILGIGDNIHREKIGKFILSKSQNLHSVIDPNSSISKTTNIGLGVFVSKGVLINAFTKISDFTILNTGCIIEHECQIGMAAHVAPGAVLAGNVIIGDRSFIVANSVIKQGVKIGNDVIIGAGSVILNDVKDNQTVVGNPSRIIK